MRVAGYVRVSTDEQAEKGNSLFEQQERQTAYCVAMGWDAPHFFIDDGYSAKNMKRPAVIDMIKRVENNEFDVVLNTKLDRLCRNLLELLQTVNLCTEHNCAYVSVSEGFDTSTAVGRMTMQILGAFAEFERGRTSERVKENMISLARNTDKALSGACYGYDIIESRYVINEFEARFVNYMFDLAEQGYGHRKIAQYLNLAGATTKRGKQWDQTNVKRLMMNKTLIGTSIHNMRENRNGKIVIRPESEWVVSENNHSAIIDKDRYEAVQAVFKSRARLGKHADNETYILTGVIRCGYCGATMKGQTSRNKNKYGEYTYYRYICSSYVSGYGCKYHAVHRNDIEKFVISEIERLADLSEKEDPDIVVKAASSEEEISEVNNLLAKTDKKMQKHIEAFENDLVSAADLKIARERIDQERAELRKRLEKLKTMRVDIKALKAKAGSLLVDINGIDRLKAKAGISKIIHKLKVSDAHVDFVWIP